LYCHHFGSVIVGKLLHYNLLIQNYLLWNHWAYWNLTCNILWMLLYYDNKSFLIWSEINYRSKKPHWQRAIQGVFCFICTCICIYNVCGWFIFQRFQYWLYLFFMFLIKCPSSITTTYAVSAYHHWSCEFEPRSWRGVLDTSLCDLQQVVVFSLYSGFLRHGITEILLKVALNTISLNPRVCSFCMSFTLQYYKGSTPKIFIVRHKVQFP
jgi:hypothetical protein